MFTEAEKKENMKNVSMDAESESRDV